MSDKEDMWEACLSLRPNYRREAFERHWDEFVKLKERAEELKAQGISIHPNFATISKD
jgi:hypothetical protein